MTHHHAADLGTTIITGAAGGMGRPAAHRFATKGRRLLLCDLKPEPLEALAEELRAGGAAIDILAGDVADPDFPGQVLAALGDAPLGALVHTAGISPTMGGPERILDINLFASERLVLALRPRLARGGCAVLISSCSAYMVPPGTFGTLLPDWLASGDSAPLLAFAASPQIAYPLSKLGIIALVGRESVAFGAAGARITSIAPGFIDTAMGRAEMVVSEQMRAMIARTPLARLGSGDEIASVADFLCSPAASYISGCDIKVDGGILGSMGR
jgi:NAD(P)-dependent dehydrogenase (short-subunit alcohol dehydrogenase family)